MVVGVVIGTRTPGMVTWLVLVVVRAGPGYDGLCDYVKADYTGMVTWPKSSKELRAKTIR